MKLLGCHIDNFGAFSDYDLTFNDGLNVIMQANGWGKTTLAAFVKAMLYGFEGKRVRDLTQNERLRYKPWQGGKYGGSLDFEAGGEEYRVIRTFGATASKDTLKVVNIDTGKSALPEIGEDVGEWLFGLDANAFQKSVFVVQNGFGFDGSTAGLRNRLNSLVNEADDVAGFDKAKDRLENRRKFYKKTGNRGAIADITKDIAKLVDADSKAEARIAELRGMAAEMEVIDASLAELDGHIAETQSLVEKDQAAVQQEQALLKVGGQLRQRQQDTKAAYEKALSSFNGRVPTQEALDDARQGIADLERVEREAVAANAAAKAAADARMAVATKYPNGLPARQEVQDMREKVAGLAAMESAAAASRPEVDEDFERLRSTMEKDPGLRGRIEKAVGGLAEANDAAAASKAAGDELRSARAQWGERRRRLVQIADESTERMTAVPADAGERAEALKKDARELRSVADEIVKLEARRDTFETQLADEREKLEALSDVSKVDPAQIESVEAAAKAADEAAEALSAARDEREEKASRVDELRRQADEAQAKLDAEREAAAQVKAPSPAPALVSLAVAAGAAVAGFVMGPASMVAFGLYAIAAVLAVVGIVMLARRKPPAPAEPEAETVRSAEDARRSYEDARAEARQSEERLSAAEGDARAANEKLSGLASELFSDGETDGARVSAKLPALRQRLAARADQMKRVEDATAKLDASKSELEEARKRARSISERHLEASGETDAEIASSMEALAGELAGLERDAKAARTRLASTVAEEMGIDPGEVQDKEIQVFLFSLEQEEPPEADALAEREKAAKAAVAAYLKTLNELLGAVGLGSVGEGDLAVGVERLQKTLAAYDEGLSRAKASEQKASTQAETLASARSEILAWAKRAGATGTEQLTDEWFAALEADISADEKGAWEERKAREKAEATQRSLVELRTKTGSFFARYGIDRQQDPAAELEGISRKAQEIADLKKASELAEEELRTWTAENREAVESASTRAKNPQVQEEAARRLEYLRKQRDAIVKERAQREEQRNAILETLESRLVVRQELELLSKKRQAATANLFTITKTAELLQKAREGLDGRYLGDLAGRFDDYANAWLSDEDIEASVDSEFGVSLYDGDVAHDVAGYSTGYQDLLDICFRMALVDTVFQAEPPFLIMDDPFCSLDEAKIRRAFMLLETLSARYQVIYFTCHPSRMEAGDEAEGSAAFVLPEQHARRELPRARAKREAEERAKAQADLVASYAVVPVTGGRASIKPRGRHSVTSNLLNVEFELDESAGSRDNTFEVHFIDEKGRVLCDRQTVEVMGGRTVPDRVRFSLSTREDSGSMYDMIIHEEGREPAELAARIPYTADVSFANDDFGF